MAGVLGAIVVALAGAFLVLAVLARRDRTGAPTHAPEPSDPAVLLFQGESLVEATAAGRRLLGDHGTGSDLAALLSALSGEFGADLPQRLANLRRTGRLVLPSGTGDGSLEAEKDEDALRVTVRLGEGQQATLERLARASAEEELRLLRRLAEEAPQAIWAIDPAGALIWANRACLALADMGPKGEGRRARARRRGIWPSAPFFEPFGEMAEGVPQRRRIPLERPRRGGCAWFDVTAVRQGGATLHFATEVSDLVRAESARTQVMQALSGTFADLSTGLAVFDAERRLVQFNPALLDLTGLSAEALSARPSVPAVLDRLRGIRALPAPRNYKAWRDELAALEARAGEGSYGEVWTLPSGRRLRVTGRPHPGGALAFLVEDVSDELDQIRRLRAELAMAHAALRAQDGALAVFGPDGAMVLSNAVYEELWQAAPTAIRGLGQERGRWRRGCRPGPAWEAFDHALAEGTAGWTGSVQHRDGRPLRLSAAALPGGATVVSFDPGSRAASPAAAGADAAKLSAPPRPARRRPAAAGA